MSDDRHYLAIFQIGPVQEFIQTAKKITDYWSGSFLLSYFCANAVHIIGEDQVIFPSVNKNRLYVQADKPLPWLKPDDETLRPSLPNRLLCRLTAQSDEEVSEKLAAARTKVRDRWKEVQEIIWKNLPDQVKNSHLIKQIWDRQVLHPLEILYVWKVWSGEDQDYSQEYQEIEALMGARKASRWFGEEKPEPGHKCSLCGERQALHSNKGAWRSEIRQEWKTKMRAAKEGLRYRFRQGETLCAICTVKRLAPYLVFGKTLDTPSTSTVAMGAVVKKILGKKDNPIFLKKIEEFRKKVRTAAKDADEPSESDPLPLNEAAEGLLDMDGDWFYPEFYSKLSNDLHKKPKSTASIKAADEARENLLKAWETKASEKLRPWKYYAVLAADGDNLGKALGSVKSENGHRVLSAALAAFSQEHAIKVLERRHLGYVVYFGGDEGAAFLALEDLFKALRLLRKSWEDNVVPAFKAHSPAADAPTLSMGAVVAHHQRGLRGVIRRAQEALVRAKDEIHKKDGFCVILDRRSGGTISCRSKWLLDGLDVPDLLDRLVTAYREGVLSSGWVHDLQQLAGAVGDPPRNLKGQNSEGKDVRQDWVKNAAKMCASETARLMRRHCRGKEHVEAVVELAAELEKLNTELLAGITQNLNEGRFNDFINLMVLAQYVAKGGGR